MSTPIKFKAGILLDQQRQGSFSEKTLIQKPNAPVNCIHRPLGAGD